MKLNDVNKGINKNVRRLRVGRGPGSGRGRTAGRGNKGQGQLAGWSAPSIFEGGGTALRDGVGFGGNKQAAEAVGKAVAERAKAAGIDQVCFDRGSFRYHGRVAALAEAARAAGLQF